METISKAITVELTINNPIEKVWAHWNEPKHITKWYFASDDWCAPSSENDLRTGEKFKTRMAFIRNNQIIMYLYVQNRACFYNFVCNINISLARP